MAPVRAVTFDVNGTLIHSPHIGEIYAEILQRHGFKVSAAETLDIIYEVWQERDCDCQPGADRFAAHPGGARGWWFEFAERVCERLGVGAPSRFAKAELFDKFAQAAAWEVYPEVPEALAQLDRSGLRLAVLSNWDERLPELLRNLDLARFFEVVVYSAGVGVEKPFAGIFHRALEVLQLAPAEVLHVGDRQLEDVEGAQSVGMQAVHLEREGGEGKMSDLRALVDQLA